MQPTVSVIIPVLNASASLAEVLEAIENQTYGRDRIEVIVIDNGSEDGLETVISTYDVMLLRQTEVKSPYESRNRGLEAASGDILVFTDANKVPDNRWIEEGVAVLNRENAALAGGAIRFSLGSNPTLSELYDALMFNDNERLIREEGGAATGNLFIRKETADQIGPFDGEHRSGMDLVWTRRALSLGHKLIYAEQAVVTCRPRTFGELLRKSYRIGRLFRVVNRFHGRPDSYTIKHTFRTFLPPKPSAIRQRLEQSERNGSVWPLWTVAWLNKIVLGLGRIRGLSAGREVPIKR